MQLYVGFDIWNNGIYHYEKESSIYYNFSFIPFLILLLSIVSYMFSWCVVWYVWAGNALRKYGEGEPAKVISEEQLSTAELELRIKILQDDRYLVC
jgi:hypothetical protein